MVRVAAFPTLILFAACADASVPGYSRETLPDGRVVVSYASGLPAAEDTLVTLFEVGKYVDDSSRIFGDLRDVAVPPDGRIFALDAQAAEIRVFTPDGTPDTVIARSGEGPGEFGQPNGLRFGPDGTLWVNDPRKRAVLALDARGVERDRPQAIVPGFGFRWGVVIDTAGVLWEPWSRQLSGAEPDMNATGIAEGTSRRMFLTFDPSTGARDSVELDATSYRSYRASYAGGQVVMGLPFAPRGLMAFDPRHRLWVATSDSFVVRRMTTSADTTLELRVAASGDPITDEDVARWKEGLSDFAENLPTLVDDLLEFLPATKPPLQALFVDDRDRLWVQRAVPRGTPPRWDVFSTEGELLASVRAPAGIESSFFEPRVVEDRIYLINEGEAGERYIVVAEVPARLR